LIFLRSSRIKLLI